MVKQVYLDKTPLDLAQKRWFQALESAHFFRTVPESVPTTEAFERVTAAPVVAARAVPHVRTSAMDGIAVRAAQTAGAGLDRPLGLRRGRDFVWVDTGDSLSPDFDAVVVIEALDFADEEAVELRQAAFPGQNVRPEGEDFAEGQTLLAAGQRLTPEAVAACLAAGVLRVEVVRRPSVFVVPTGSELTSPLEALPPGKYPETNSALFLGYLRRWGAQATLHPLIEDDPTSIANAVSRGLDEHDIVLVNAGTSKGREDLTASVFERLGQVQVHGVSMHPGHPVVLGVARNKPLVGVPGYPVATWATLEQFVLPLLEKYYACPLQSRRTLSGTLERSVHSPLGEVEFVRVRLERVDGGVRVHPLTGKASALSSLVQADGVLDVPAALSGYAQGESVPVRLLHNGRPVFEREQNDG